MVTGSYSLVYHLSAEYQNFIVAIDAIKSPTLVHEALKMRSGVKPWMRTWWNWREAQPRRLLTTQKDKKKRCRWVYTMNTMKYIYRDVISILSEISCKDVHMDLWNTLQRDISTSGEDKYYENNSCPNCLLLLGFPAIWC